MRKFFSLVLTAVAFIFAACSSNASKEEADNQEPVLMNVASFNIRMDTPNDGENAWPHRKELAKALIRFHDFDIFGVQEAFRSQ